MTPSLAANGADRIYALEAELARQQQVIQDQRTTIQRYRALVDRSWDGLIMFDAAGHILYDSPNIAGILGYTSTERLGTDAFAFIHPEERATIRAHFAELVQTVGGSHTLQLRVQHKNGSYRWLEGTATNLLHDPAIGAVVCNYHDITDRRQAEEALLRAHDELEGRVQQRTAELAAANEKLRESEQRMRLIVDSAFDAFVAIDAEGRIIDWNPQSEVLFGWDRTEVMGQSLAAIIIPHHYREAHQRGLAAFLTTGSGPMLNQRIEVAALHRDGHEFPLEVTISPVPWRGSYLFFAFVQDITERKQAEEALRHAKESAETASQAKSEFLARMSHELRTPLNSVIGFANVLLKNKAGNLRKQDLTYLQRIVDNGKHLLSLINDVLDIAKVEAGRMGVELASVSINDLVTEVVQQLEGGVRTKEVQLRLKLPLKVAPLQTDPGKLKQILINLVGNALKFTARGSITVRVVVAPPTLQPCYIEVSDTGIGIAPDRLPTIFDAFQQADSTTTRRYGGTGLGLTISNALCDLLGYRLTVESTLGHGSTFRVWLGST